KKSGNVRYALREDKSAFSVLKIFAPWRLCVTIFLSPRRPAAVDQHVCAGDEARVLRAQVHGQFADLLDLAPTSQGNAGNELLVQFRVLEDRRIDLRRKGSGTDPVDGYFFRREFQCESSSESEQTRF